MPKGRALAEALDAGDYFFSPPFPGGGVVEKQVARRPLAAVDASDSEVLEKREARNGSPPVVQGQGLKRFQKVNGWSDCLAAGLERANWSGRMWTWGGNGTWRRRAEKDIKCCNYKKMDQMGQAGWHSCSMRERESWTTHAWSQPSMLEHRGTNYRHTFVDTECLLELPRPAEQRAACRATGERVAGGGGLVEGEPLPHRGLQLQFGRVLGLTVWRREEEKKKIKNEMEYLEMR
jgi:hypothetical protein